MHMIDRGKELAGALIFKRDGKPLAGPPKSGQVAIAMKPGRRFCGDPAAAVRALARAFPGVKFKWERP